MTRRQPPYHPPNARTHAKRLRRLAELKDDLRGIEEEIIGATRRDDADYREYLRDELKAVTAEIQKHERLIALAATSAGRGRLVR